MLKEENLNTNRVYMFHVSMLQIIMYLVVRPFKINQKITKIGCKEAEKYNIYSKSFIL